MSAIISRLVTRIGIYCLTFIVASIIIFALLAVLPGNAAQVVLGVNASPSAVRQTMKEFGLNRPLVVQYVSWMSHFLRGSLGRSYLSGAAIGPQIAEHAAVTAWLVGLGLVVAVVVGVLLGVAAAVMQRTMIGTLLSAITQFGMAIPSFIMGILLIDVFAVRLGWVPSGGWTSPGGDVGLFVREMALPVLSLGLVEGALLSRYVRSATLNVLREDYIRTARAKGLRPWRAFVRHGMRNAAIPVVTVLAVEACALLVGAIIIETVFVLPGMGSLLLNSVTNRDLVVVQDIVMILVIVVLVVNLFMDAAYLWLDPRTRVGM